MAGHAANPPGVVVQHHTVQSSNTPTNTVQTNTVQSPHNVLECDVGQSGDMCVNGARQIIAIRVRDPHTYNVAMYGMAYLCDGHANIAATYWDRPVPKNFAVVDLDACTVVPKRPRHEHTDDQCCGEHGHHVSPHRGCVLR